MTRHFLATVVVLLSAVAGILLSSAPASACSLEQRPLPMRLAPAARDGQVPRNVVFSPPASRGNLDTENYFWSTDGVAVDLQEDRELSAILQFDEPYASLSTTVFRPLEELDPGDGIAACYRDSCGDELAIVTDSVDESPPERPEIKQVLVTLYDNPALGKGTFCPELDYIEVDISSSDDTTPLELMRVLIYAAPTEEAVEELRSPEAGVSGELLEDDPSVLRVESWLGLDSKRDSYYSPFSRGEDVCFSVAMMDWAGNVSERSEVECINTRDPEASYARVVEGGGCGCNSGDGRPSLPAGLVLAALGLAALRIRASRRAATQTPD